MARDKQLGMRIIRWIQRNLPTREQIEGVRWLRPVAHRVLAPELWRFTRRSVPRGVALGIVTGVLLPVAQIPLSAVLALPIRANIPAAALTTFITNPLTTPLIWVAAYQVGSWLLHFDAGLPGNPINQAAANSGWWDWLLAEAGPALAVGLVFLALAGAVVAYFLSAWGWRLWIASKWRRRHRRHTAAPERG